MQELLHRFTKGRNIMERTRRTFTWAIHISSLLAAVVLWPIPLLATTYTVKAAGGGNFTTIGACMSAMSSSGGDTCTVYAGTYNEAPTMKAGTVGNYNVLTVNGSDVVTINGVTPASHTKLIGNCPDPWVNGAQALGSCGFSIGTLSSTWGTPCIGASGVTDVYIVGNTMEYCGGNNKGWGTDSNSQAIVFWGNSSFIYILQNTITHPCNPGTQWVCEAISISTNHAIIEHNDLSNNDDSIEYAGDFNVVRHNAFHDITEANCNTSFHGSNCHPDLFESEPYSETQHELFESNHAYNLGGGDMHALLTQSDVCSGTCQHDISRFNEFLGPTNSFNLSYMILNDLGTWPHNRWYNNSASHGGTHLSCCTAMLHGPASPDLTAKNELWYDFGTAAGLNSSNYFDGSGTVVANNLINPTTNPYANGSTFPLTLANGSAAIGAGGALTTTGNSGSNSTSLTVADPWYFQDGWGFPAGTGVGQMSPDWIRIGSSTVVQIASGGINYSTGAITLASPVSWPSGAPVYIYKISDGTQVLFNANPDQGAVSYQVSGGPRITPSPVAFPNQTIGIQSSPLTVTVTNTGSATLTLNTPYFTITGINAADLSNAGTGTCTNGGSVLAGSSCTVLLVFTPSVEAAETATLNISGNANGSAAINGTGIPTPPTSLTFTVN